MVYLEHPEGKFWRCEQTAEKEVTISYGKCGCDGRTMIKDFGKNGGDASAYVEKQEAAKRKGGYADVEDPTSSKKVYLEHPGGKFWRCEKTGEKEVTTVYGKCGCAGRKMSKDFDESDDASAYVEKQEAAKRKGGYADAEDPITSSKTSGKKRKADPTPPTASKKVGLKNHAAPCDTGDDEGATLDSGVAGADSALASRATIHKGFHAKLALVDPSKNHDKYYILQVLFDENKKKSRGRSKKTKQGHQYYLFTRWGRTGTGGQAKLEGPWTDGGDTAENSFAKVFKSKTGVEWEKAVPGTAPKSNKYEYLSAATKSDDGGSWFYFLQNDPLGKPDGWYNYHKDNNQETEELFGEYVASSKAARLSTRLIHSETSGFSYRIDLQAMTQQNTQSGMTRPISRSTSGCAPLNNPTVPVRPTPQLTTPGTAQQTPHKAVSARGPAKKSAPAAVRSLAAPIAAAGAVDSAASGPLQSGSIYSEYDVMLNQTNIGANNNKFYKIQLVEMSAGVHLFTKWGRVGEAGATQEVGPMDSETAVKEFEKKFRAKTGNKWTEREDFQSKKGKYAMVEMEKDAHAAVAMSKCASAASGSSSSRKTLPCTLGTETKSLIDLIFNEDMFKSAMTAMNLDPTKLPLGALSKAQIERGFEALEELEEEIDCAARPNTLMELTSNFYTVIPHAFGRSRGPVLNTKESVSEKYEMLNTLTDIEAAQTMQKKNQQALSDREEAVEHPSDLNYKQLATDLTIVADDDEDRPVIEQYLKNTMSTGYRGGMKLRDVWRVDRHKESERFDEHKHIDNRRLLWHGTNVAVVAAIMKSGLRIMPHSGGRVGCGIYMADQVEKSAWYVSPARGTIIMFLVEAALGKQYEITRDDPSLVSAPNGYDSVLAKGTKVPTKDVELVIDGNTVKVPQGKAVDAKLSGSSSFAHNEFLVYKESQHRIRYILTFDE